MYFRSVYASQSLITAVLKRKDPDYVLYSLVFSRAHHFSKCVVVHSLQLTGQSASSFQFDRRAQVVKKMITELPVFIVLSATVLWQRTTFKEHSPFGKLIVNQLANKLQALQATRRFIVVSATVGWYLC